MSVAQPFPSPILTLRDKSETRIFKTTFETIASTIYYSIHNSGVFVLLDKHTFTFTLPHISSHKRLQSSQSPFIDRQILKLLNWSKILTLFVLRAPKREKRRGHGPRANTATKSYLILNRRTHFVTCHPRTKVMKFMSS